MHTLLAVLVSSIALSGCGMLILTKAERDASGGSTVANASEDVQFLRDIAEANLAEIAAGKLAAGKAQSPEVRNYGQHMVDEHTRAHKEAATLARARGLSLPEGPSGQRQGAARKLEDLSGADFDRAYMAQMVKDHGDTLQLLEKTAAQAQGKDLREFAQAAMAHVRKHLEAAQRLKDGG